MFVYELPLVVNEQQDLDFQKRFRMAEDIYRKSMIYCLKQQRKIEKDPRYKRAYKKLPKGKERNELLRELDNDYGIQGKFSLTKFANDYRNQLGYASYIPSDTAGKLGVSVWETFSLLKFTTKTKRVNIGRHHLNSIDGKSAKSGLTIKNGYFQLSTRDKSKTIRVKVKYRNTDYERDVLRNKLKFNRLVRKFVRGKWKYYVQMIFDGIPPQYLNDDQALETTVGLDIGTSTIATSSHYQTELRSLATNKQDESQEMSRLHRKLDRQRRANNEDNYNEDGTIKRGKKVWHDSNRYLETKAELTELSRKQAARRLNHHKTLANEIVTMGNRFVVEQMSFSGLQARAKETTVNEKTGRFNRKKRFGKSLLNHAPAMLIQQIQYKAEYSGKDFIKADTRSIKASQLNHITEQYEKVSLSTRSKTVGEHVVQRDLYSAFLLQHVNNDGKTVNIDECESDFDTFIRNQKVTIDALKDSENVTSSMGNLEKY